MRRFWKAALVALLAVLILVPGGLARAEDRDDGGFRGGDRDFRGFVGPDIDIYPGFGWGWGSPWYGGWGWGWGNPWYYPGPTTGDVQIKTNRRNAEVYVDGGYVGRAGKVKKIPLRPGPHTIQLRNSQRHTFYQKQVYVVRGKTVKLDAYYSNQPPRAGPANSQAVPATRPGDRAPSSASAYTGQP